MLAHVAVVFAVKCVLDLRFTPEAVSRESLGPPLPVCPGEMTVNGVAQLVDVNSPERPLLVRILLRSVDVEGEDRAEHRIRAERRNVAEGERDRRRDLIEAREVLVHSIRVQVLEHVEPEDHVVVAAKRERQHIALMNPLCTRGEARAIAIELISTPSAAMP